MPDPYESSQGGTLLNVDKSGTVPKSRLATAEAARSMLSGLIRGDYAASQSRTRVQGMIDGNPMFTDAQLKEANMDWVPRANWGGARAKIRDHLTAYNDIISSSETLPVVSVTVGDPRTRIAISQIFSEEFHASLFRTFDDWSFIYHMKLHHSQRSIHGVGPCFWRDRRDWRFHALKRRNILVPKESPSDVSRLRCVFVRDFLYVDELYEMAGGDTGKWDKPAVLDAMRHAQKKDATNFDWETAQEKYKNNAYDWAYNESDVVKVAHAFVKEFSGKVSHHIFTENSAGDSTKKAGDGYLFSQIDAYEHIGQAVWVCFQDVGNGDFESVRGLGLEAYHFGEAQNRLNNGLIQNAIENGTVMWQAESPEVADKFTRVEIGAHRVLPTGLTQVQVNNGAAIQAQLSVAQHFSMLEESNTGVYRARSAGPSNQARTATEVEAEIGETSKLSNSDVSDYLIQFDRLLSETFRRITLKNIMERDGGGKEALDFKERCIARGVPEEYFHELAETAIVTAKRPVGNGSYADRVSRLSRISSVIGNSPQRKQAQFYRDFISQIGGSRDLADAYGPDIEQSFPGIEASVAILENNGFMAGGTQDPFSPDNAHEVHFPIHFEFIVNLLKSGDAQRSAPVLAQAEQHAAEHVEALQGDPTKRAQFAAFEKQLGQLQNAIKQVQHMAELMTEQQTPPDQNPEMMKVQLDAQTQAAATRADIARKDAKAKQQLALNDAKTAQRLRLDQEQHDQRIRLAGTGDGNGQ